MHGNDTIISNTKIVGDETALDLQHLVNGVDNVGIRVDNIGINASHEIEKHEPSGHQSVVILETNDEMV